MRSLSSQMLCRRSPGGDPEVICGKELDRPVAFTLMVMDNTHPKPEHSGEAWQKPVKSEWKGPFPEGDERWAHVLLEKTLSKGVMG